MQEAIQAKHDHDVDAVVWFEKIVEFVFLDDFFWDVTDFHSDIFRVLEGSVEVKA